MKNIYLVGMMGSGKTVTGRILAKLLDRTFVDLDSVIVEQEGMPIVSIFENKGECYFRNKESTVLKAVSNEEKRIVATGGGIVVDVSNIDLMKKTGKIVYFQADLEVLWEYTQRASDRPLLKVENPKQVLEKIFTSRKEKYELADIILPIGRKTPDNVAEDLLKILKGEEK